MELVVLILMMRGPHVLQADPGHPLQGARGECLKWDALDLPKEHEIHTAYMITTTPQTPTLVAMGHHLLHFVRNAGEGASHLDLPEEHEIHTVYIITTTPQNKHQQWLQWVTHLLQLWLPVLAFVVCCGVGGGGGVDVYNMYLMLLRRIQDIR